MDWFKKIPSRRVVCFLDCCFSGGAAAKVIGVEVKPKGIASAETYLKQLQGDGRLVITASGAEEEAWEDAALRHGLLTYYLLQALFGVGGASGKVSLTELLNYVGKTVEEGSTKLGKKQTPMISGAFDVTFGWPIFVHGELYQKSSPDGTAIRIGADLAGLSHFGFSAQLLDHLSGAIPSLNKLQVKAINEFNILKGEHVVVSAPTSSGKTMIGELAALKGALEHKRTFFLLPLRALVNDKYEYFVRHYGDFGIKVIRATSEIFEDMPDLILGRYDLCLMTYEKFANMLMVVPHLLNQAGTVVIDEVQMITNDTRGANLEFVLTLLKVRREQGIAPQLIALSAVIGNTNGLEEWLGAKLLQWHERPVPLDEGILTRDGTFRYLDADGQEQTEENYITRIHQKDTKQDWIIPLVKRLVSEKKQVIVFRPQKPEAESTALYLAKALGLPPAQEALDALPIGDPSGASTILRQALQGGVACHTANLGRDERLIVEEEFRRKGTSLWVIAATSTLAMGVNTPAEAVIIAGLQYPPPENKFYTVAEYKNLVGRAGRLGLATKGFSFVISITTRDEEVAWNRYVLGKPEALISRFIDTGDPRSMIIRVFVTNIAQSAGLTEDEVISFLELSFGAFQQRQKSNSWIWNRNNLKSALNNLQSHGLVNADDKGRFHLTELGKLAGENGVEVETITRIVEIIRNLRIEDINDPTLITLIQKSIELENEYLPFHHRGFRTEYVRWPSYLRNLGVPEQVMEKISPLEAKKASACLLWITQLTTAEIEAALCQHLPRTEASAELFHIVDRSSDLLPTIVRAVQILHPELDLSTRHQRLQMRLQIGIPPIAVDIAQYAGSALTRADYLNLFNANLISIDALEAATDIQLEDALKNARNMQRKIAAIRQAVSAYRRQEKKNSTIPPLPPYES